jgi:glycosyltransferase involved in cell wall biosynthesis
MSAYNAEKTIEKAINSVLKQTYDNLELVITEDCSTDKTKEIIKRFDDNRIKLIEHNENLGAGWARYNGIKAATGDYITFLDSDDFYDLDYLENVNNYFNDYSDIDILSCGYISHTVEDNNNTIIHVKTPEKKFYQDDLYVMDKSDTARFLVVSFIKRSLWDKVDYSTRRFCEDSPTWVKILFFAKNRYMVDYAGYHYIQNPVSLIHTASKFKESLFVTLCAIEAYNFYKEHNADIDMRVVFQKFMQHTFEPTEEERKLYTNEINEVSNFIKSNIDKFLRNEN